MKVAVITAVFDGMDKEKPFCEQSLPEGFVCDRFFYTEDNSPVPLPNLPPRLQAKYFKTQSHHIPALQGYDIHVWIDGNIEVTNKGFIASLTYPLFGDEYARVCIQKHHHRDTISEEIEFILDSMDNPYLKTRYGKQPLADEYAHYIGQGMPPTAPLYSCNVFARKVGRVSNGMFDAWWALCVEWSWFDQSAFSYLAWSHGRMVHTVDMGGVTTSPYYTLHGHDEWNQ
mgnify:CR=1 FL=1